MFSSSVAPLSFLLLTPYSPVLFIDNDDVQARCLTNSFYGIYGGQSVFKLTDPSCLSVESFGTLEGGSLLPLSENTHQLVWVQESAVDDALRTPDYEEEVYTFLKFLNTESLPINAALHGSGQEFMSSKPGVELLHSSASSALLAVDPDSAQTIDTILPRFWKSAILPASPVSYLPVPAPAIDHIKGLLSTLKFDPVIASTVNSLSISQMRSDIRFLTNEDGRSGIVTRHSFASGSRVAADWLLERFEETGATCELKSFLVGFAPNVICRYPSTTETTSTVLISGHYDSRGSFGSQRAPGGNDDGSGTIALLNIARAIAKTGITFRSNVELVAFAGEEQGLLGSKAYAREMRNQDANITLMIQADMLGYHAPGEPAQLGLPQSIGTPEVAELVSKVSGIYSPELTIGYSPACCSDHQSFYELGYPSTQVFERAGPIADPMYHNSGDVSDRVGYDLHQIRSIAKVQFATLLHAAGFDLPEYENLQ
ncbi:Zn-dependent exopeptidase [Leucogyrophana mollusca]|uniref:Zn-dependent exopeptidase n=1 Tax=Leucogyrophana mollusca TaxID=85980 RepID=A0ACB8BFL7_9AGAM|nr:Zn-dependent exopeptidase [Leucogyrophana mollusca]